MNLLFTAPITRAKVDGGATISGIAIRSCFVDPDALTATVVVSAIEDGPGIGPSRATIVIPITGAMTFSQLLAAIKSQVATALGVTFQ